MFGRGGKRSAERVEPRLEASSVRARSDDLRADPEDRTCAVRKKTAAREVRTRAAPPRSRSAPWSADCLLELRARRLGRHRPRRPVRLLREPIAADRSARGAEAPAQYRDPRRRRIAAGQPGRHRRRRRAARAICRPICPRLSSRSRIGASIRISASIRSASRARSSAT